MALDVIMLLLGSLSNDDDRLPGATWGQHFAGRSANRE
jgi:hypothetical protein